MAISFKSDDDYGYSLLPLFGVASDLISKAKSMGVKVTQGSPGMFMVSYNGKVSASVSVKGSAISLAKQKTLGPASKQSIAFQFNTGLTKAVDMAIADGGIGDFKSSPSVADFMPPTPSNLKPSVNPFKKIADEGLDGVVPINFLKANTKIIPAAPQFTPGTVKEGPLNIMKASTPKVATLSKVPMGAALFPKVNPVPLHQASKCYQPVNGTTGGSIYYVLVMHEGLNFAARVKGNNLSMRAEGPNLKNFQKAFDTLGMDMKADYCSVHFEVSSQELMLKTLGATVGLLGYSGIKEVADLDVFIKGQS